MSDDQAMDMDAGDDAALLSALAFMDDFHLPPSLDDDASTALDAATLSAAAVEAAELVHSAQSPAPPTLAKRSATPPLRALPLSAGRSRRPQQQQKRAIAQSAIKAKSASSTNSSTNKARDGRKEELIYLRKKVAELEQQLADAKQRQQLQTPQPSDARDATETDAASASPLHSAPAARRRTAEPSVWADIVRRQQTQRAKAERENIRLKLVLENQLKIAKSLEKMVQKSSCTKEFDKVLLGRQRFDWAAHAPPPPPQDADACLIDELLAGLDQSYVEAESVFEANGLARKARTTQIDAVVRPDERCGIQLEVFASKVLPFDMRAAGAVVWNHYALGKDRLPNRVYHHNTPQALNETEDTIIEDFNLEIDVQNAMALYRVRLVMRRYTEEHRVVIVWRAYSDTLRIADEPTDGVRFLERGYIVIREAAPRRRAPAHRTTGGPDTASPHNVLQTCYLTTPVSNGILADADASKIGVITDYVISATAANISSSHEIIENVLLEQAIKTPWTAPVATPQTTATT